MTLRCHGNAQAGPPRVFHVPKDVFRVVCYPYFPPTPSATERFLETVRLFPFLYDKTQPDYQDNDAKNNRWEIIGEEFGITGEFLHGTCCMSSVL